MARLKILFVASECVPIVKTGGLGDVVGALPPALRARGHDVRIVLPRHRQAKGYPAEVLPGPLGVPVGGGTCWTGVYRAEIAGGVPVYLLEHDALFDREGVYGDASGEFGDSLWRFLFLSRGALELCRHVDFEPDVLHAHDWQAALVPVLNPPDGPATVLSVHNLGYQGIFGVGELPRMRLTAEQERDVEYFGNVNLLKAGLTRATLLSTVSPRYAREIQSADGGAGLDGLLRQRRRDLVGILNGIDEARWNPATDLHLPATYDPDDLEGKARCKAALQQELGLPVRPDVPLVGLVSRLAEQKGIDIFVDALGYLAGLDLQFAVLGSGLAWAEQVFERLSATTSHFRARIGIDDALSHRIYAGADLFAVPSRYEPCGLTQLYSQRYGTVPVVRGVGGLDDTVDHEVSGFKFQELSGRALALSLAWAADCYRHRPEHFQQMQRFSMRKRMGWNRVAAQYDALYRLAIARRRGRL
ncbi:MAG: glycogen synthase [Polyangiaceae bacterium]|nr:glycogen synthase [Polyangiaceae bacterium]